jgi:hypothetical protein
MTIKVSLDVGFFGANLYLEQPTDDPYMRNYEFEAGSVVVGDPSSRYKWLD